MTSGLFFLFQMVRLLAIEHKGAFVLLERVFDQIVQYLSSSKVIAGINWEWLGRLVRNLSVILPESMPK